MPWMNERDPMQQWYETKGNGLGHFPPNSAPDYPPIEPEPESPAPAPDRYPSPDPPSPKKWDEDDGPIPTP